MPNNAPENAPANPPESSPSAPPMEETQQSPDLFSDPEAAVKHFFFIQEKGKAPQLKANPGDLAILCGVTVLILGSAFWAASIATARRHKPALHFLLGLVLPWIYPIYILFKLDIPGVWEFSKNKKDVKKNVEENAPKHELQIDENGQYIFEQSQLYFQKIARNADGQPDGPWDCVFNNNEIVVTEIIDALPEALNVAFYDASSTDVRKMRIPYARITSWQKHVEG